MFAAAVASAQPDRCLPPHLPQPPKGRTVVVGAGKAAAAMAHTVEAHWPAPLTGVVVTRYGHTVPTARIEVIEAAHPVPDAAGIAAAERLLGAVAGLTADDLVLCLLSGGGSALLPAPPPGVTLEDERHLTRALLRSGAPISELNCVRKHLSGIKGGRLAAAAAPARVVTLAISDVPGDDPATIASGPTLPDRTTRHDALSIIEARAPEAAASIRAWLENPQSETPKPGMLATEATLIATARHALEAAAEVARAAGYAPVILSDAIEGEARDVALMHAAIVREHLNGPPVALLSGGETAVTVRGNGRGGRNVEFLLALTLALQGTDGWAAFAGDSDGIDGTEDNAGALADAGTLERARRAGLNAAAMLADNDAYTLFAALDALVVTGPTLTNENDIRAILIGAPQEQP